MKTVVYKCENCGSQVNDSDKECPKCNSQFEKIDDKLARVALSVGKKLVQAFKEKLKKMDPKAKLSIFTPISKQEQGFIVKTSNPEKLSALIKEMHLRIVREGKLAVGNSPSFTLLGECAHCGVTVDDSDSFCTSCGNSIELNDAMPKVGDIYEDKTGGKVRVYYVGKDRVKWEGVSGVGSKGKSEVKTEDWDMEMKRKGFKFVKNMG